MVSGNCNSVVRDKVVIVLFLLLSVVVDVIRSDDVVSGDCNSVVRNKVVVILFLLLSLVVDVSGGICRSNNVMSGHCNGVVRGVVKVVILLFLSQVASGGVSSDKHGSESCLEHHPVFQSETFLLL